MHCIGNPQKRSAHAQSIGTECTPFIFINGSPDASKKNHEAKKKNQNV